MVSKGGKYMGSKILEYFDFEKINPLLEGFNQSTGFVTAILDLDGKILSKSGWRQICTDFHRVNPHSALNCTISDTDLSNANVESGKYHFYKCMNGLIDVQAPIVIRGEHVANLFSGQFFFNNPDIDFFKEQAKLFGFDESSYLEALDQVPVISKEKVEIAMEFLLYLIQIIIEITTEKMEQLELNEAILRSETALLEGQAQLQQNVHDLLESQKIAHIGTWRLNLATNQVVWSEELYKMYGFDPSIAPPPYTEHMKLFTAESWTKLSTALDRTSKLGVPYELELETVTKDGSNGWMWARGEATKDSKGNIISLWGAAQDITEYKRTQFEIAESREYFETMFNTNLDAALVTRLCDGCIINVNDGFSALTGYSRVEAEGKSVIDLNLYHVPTERQRIVNILKEKGYCIGEELEFQRSDKSIFTGLISVKLIKLKGIDYIVTNVHDITSRKQAEQQLKDSEQRFKILHNASFGGIAVHDNGLILECNQGLSDITGYSINELVGMDGLLLIAPEYRAFVMSKITSGYEEVYEAYGIRKSQEIFPLQLQARNMPYNKKLVRAVEFRDITERKLAESASKENAFRFQSLFNEMSAGAAIYKVLNDGEYGKDYIIQDFNQAALKAEGKEITEVLGRSLYDLRPNIDQYGLIPVLQSVWKTGEPVYYPSKLYVDENFSNYYENRVYKLPSGEIVAIFEDVTEMRLAEESVRKQNDLFASLLKLLPVGVFMVDSIEGKPLVINDMGRVLLGSGLLPDANEHNLSEVYKAFKGDTQIHYPTAEMPITLGMKGISAHIDDMVVERPDGTRILLEVFGTPVLDENGNSWASLVTFIDITERKKIEDNLIYISNHDQLTGLYNRTYFEEVIKRLDVKQNLPLSIIMIDTNGLKIINDSFGHRMGDELLKKTASAILQVCRAEDISIRYGGDEFIIVLPNTDDAETLRIANTIKELVSKENIANINLSISYGYATKHSTHESIMEMLANAENHMYSHKLTERSSMRSKTIEIIMNTLFEKSPRDSQHSMRVSKICEAIAVALKFEKQEVDQMRIAGLVHDIGKIGIDEKILNKSGKLDIDERKEMERHPEAGWRILSSSNEFAKLAKYILHHHERWDGNGFPNKLTGENIPIESRIITIADAYDAITSERSYKAAMSHEDAVEEILRCSGTQFDPSIVDVFVAMSASKNIF